MDGYHIYEEVGSGSHSIVYKGREKQTIKYVAIKSVDKSKLDKVLHEVRMMFKLDHPNCLRFYKWYETRHHIWLILEYCTGGSLKELLQHDKKLPEKAIRVFGVDLLHALHYLHSTGTLFCDLKPSNVLLNEYGVLKLCDFALSRTLSQGKAKGKDRQAGTPAYMSPELFSKEGVHSFESDLWSLGCVLYMMALGHQPFFSNSNSFNELVHKIQHTPLELPVGDQGETKLSVQFKNLLRSLLRKDPAKRISWPALLTHPFWRGVPVPKLRPMPVNPAYNEYLQTREYIPSCPEEDSDHEIDDDEEEGRHETALDSMRMSMLAKRNLLRESMDSTNDLYARSFATNSQITNSTPQPDSNDLVLENEDLVLDFEEHPDEEEEDDIDFGAQFLTRPQSAPVVHDHSESIPRPLTAGAGVKAALSPSQSPTFSEPPATVHHAAAAVLRLEYDDEDESTPDNVEEDLLSVGELEEFNHEEDDAEESYDDDIDLHDSSLVEAIGEVQKSFRSRTMQSQIEILVPEDATAVSTASIQALLVDPSDHLVKPIVGTTPTASSLPVLKYNPRMLLFQNLAVDKVAQLSPADLQVFLTQVFKALSTPTISATHIVQVLGYLYTLCRNARLANVIVSSSLVALLVRLGGKPHAFLQQQTTGTLSSSSPRASTSTSSTQRPVTPPTPPGGAPSLYASTSAGNTKSQLRKIKVRVAIILAVLVRYSTYIAQRLGDEGLLPLFVAFSQEEYSPLRRYGSAGLGELLFYITANWNSPVGAGEPSDTGAVANTDEAHSWKIPGVALKQLLSCLKSDDETIRNFAAKTYENVLSTTQDNATPNTPGLRFATHDVAATLLDAAVREKSEALRSTCAMALAHLVRINRRLLPKLAERDGWGFLVNGLEAVHGASRVQQAFLNILKLVLLNSISGNAATMASSPVKPGTPIRGPNRTTPSRLGAERATREALFGSKSPVKKSILRALLQLLSHAQTFVVRSKAALTITLFLKVYPSDFPTLLEYKFVPIFDRLYQKLGMSTEDEQEQPKRPAASTTRRRAASIKMEQLIEKEGGVQGTLHIRRCLYVLMMTVFEIVQETGQAIARICQKMGPVIASGRIVGSTSPLASVLERLARDTLPIIVQMNASRSFKLFVSHNSELIACIGQLVRVSVHVVPEAAPEFHRIVLVLTESLAQQTSAMLRPEVSVQVTRVLLPALWRQGSSCTEWDVRVLCLRLVSDLLCLYLNPPIQPLDGYSDGISIDMEQLRGRICDSLYEFVVRRVLTKLRRLLDEAAPIPQIFTNLICCTTEVMKSTFVQELYKCDLLPRLAGLLPVDQGENVIEDVEIPSNPSAPVLLSLILQYKSNAIPLKSLLKEPCDMLQKTLGMFRYIVSYRCAMEQDEDPSSMMWEDGAKQTPTIDAGINLLQDMLKLIHESKDRRVFQQVLTADGLSYVLTVLAITLERCVHTFYHTKTILWVYTLSDQHQQQGFELSSVLEDDSKKQKPMVHDQSDTVMIRATTSCLLLLGKLCQESVVDRVLSCKRYESLIAVVAEITPHKQQGHDLKQARNNISAFYQLKL
mmetsp:Transcript_8898/g.16726  ORF Transcript_8898/g.16726 Transcript_8898/m.16726 type:complete len:1557 (-) Transcript_8898:1429-6099(-)